MERMIRILLAVGILATCVILLGLAVWFVYALAMWIR